MSDYVLDASAILALLNGETGSDLVLEALPHSVVSTVNLAEVCARLSGIGMAGAEIRETLSLLGLVIVPFDEESAFLSGDLRPITQSAGLSLGDRACLALAKQTGRIAVTSDRAWQTVKTGVTVRLIR